MRISILGTNGLLSKHIGLCCNKMGYELNMYGIDEPKFHSYTNYYKVDLIKGQLDFTRLNESDIIIYAVGAGIQSNLNEKYDLIYNLNVSIPIMICNGLNSIEYRGRFITFGSYWEIGATINNESFTELDILESQLEVFNNYSISKRLLTRFASSFKPKFSYWHFILPTIYGEMEQEHRLIPHTLKSIDNNSEVFFTSGEQVRQYIYIDDVANVIFDSYDSNLKSGIYNIAGVEEFTVKRLVIRLYELKGKEVSLNVFGKEKRHDVGMKVLRLNGEKLKELINYTPAIKLEDVFDRYKFFEY